MGADSGELDDLETRGGKGFTITLKIATLFNVKVKPDFYRRARPPDQPWGVTTNRVADTHLQPSGYRLPLSIDASA